MPIQIKINSSKKCTILCNSVAENLNKGTGIIFLKIKIKTFKCVYLYLKNNI